MFDFALCLARIRQLTEERPHSAAPLELLKRALSFQGRQTGGRLKPEDFLSPRGRKTLKETFIQALTALEGFPPPVSTQVPGVRIAFRRADVMARFLKATLAEETGYLLRKAREKNLNLSLLNLLGFLVLPALLVGEGPSKGTLRTNRCPCCGSRPQFGLNSAEEGRRYLFCPACYLRWPVRRDFCPLCGQEHQDTNYLFAQETPTVRAHLCPQEEKTYFKIIEARELEADSLALVEDLATLEFDLALEKKGLKRWARGLLWPP